MPGAEAHGDQAPNLLSEPQEAKPVDPNPGRVEFHRRKVKFRALIRLWDRIVGIKYPENVCIDSTRKIRLLPNAEMHMLSRVNVQGTPIVLLCWQEETIIFPWKIAPCESASTLSCVQDESSGRMYTCETTHTLLLLVQEDSNQGNSPNPYVHRTALRTMHHTALRCTAGGDDGLGSIV